MAGVSVFRPVVAAGNFDESKHPRHAKGKSEGGKFAPKSAGGLGNTDTPSVGPMARLVDDAGYDKAVGDVTSTLMEMLDDSSVEYLEFEDDETGATDEQTLASYQAAMEGLQDSGDWQEQMEEAAAAMGIDISDDESFEPGSAYSRFEADVVHRLRQKAPVFNDLFGPEELTAAFDESKIKRQPAGKRDGKKAADDGGKFAPKDSSEKAQNSGDEGEDDSKDDPGLGEEGDKGDDEKYGSLVDEAVDAVHALVNDNVEGTITDPDMYDATGLLTEEGLKKSDKRWADTLEKMQDTEEYQAAIETAAKKAGITDEKGIDDFEADVLARATGGEGKFTSKSPERAIENYAKEYTAKGYKPKDAQMGEFLTLVGPKGDEVTVGPDGVEGNDGEGARPQDKNDKLVGMLKKVDSGAKMDRTETQLAKALAKDGFVSNGKLTDKGRKLLDERGSGKDIQASADPLLGLTAAAAGMVPVHPPAEWFDDPKLEGPTPLEVTADGRVFGHLAAFGTCHIANPRGAGVCVEPPTSETGYGYFHLGQVEAEDGRRVPVGQITMDSPHAPMGASARTASSHYDHTGTAAADVRAGEDEFGIWVAGALRPSLTATAARTLMGAKLSGDWRGVKGNLELVGILAVNVPGFPVPRPKVLMADAAPVADEWPEVREALVAAGVVLERPVDEAAVRRRVRVMAVRAAGGKDALVAMAAGGAQKAVTAAGWDESKHPDQARRAAAKLDLLK